MASYQDVFENNRRWAAQRTERDPGFFANLAKGQSPEFLFIGCADSRVPAAQVMGLEPGNVFVHRNVANLVVNTDANAHACIEYAVDHLHVQHIVVCGHTNCGGVGAAMSSQDLGQLNPWLREIRDVYRMHQAELDAIADEGARYARLIELNVQEQCLNLLEKSCVQKSWRANRKPTIHGWVYDLSTGLLKDLDISMDGLESGAGNVYRLD